MFNINKLYIKIFDENRNEYGNKFSFEKKLNIILGINDSGKSTIVNAIYYVLGMEELLKDGKNIKGLKPALRKEISIDKKSIKIKDSYILMEIENSYQKKITLKRRVISSTGISESMITVFDSSIEDIDNAITKDYFLHSNSATHEKGFYKYFEEFLGVKLPKVLGYSGEEKKLYLQTIFSAFFIEQTKGWTELLAMIPTYFGIKEVKQKAIEFILGLDKNDILLEKIRLEKQKEEENIKWKVNIQTLENLIKNFSIEIEMNSNKYSEYSYNLTKVYVKKINSKLLILDYIQELKEKLIALKNTNNFIQKAEVDDIFLQIEDIQKKLVNYQEKQRELDKELLKINIQKENVGKDLNKLEEEIINFTDIEKLKKLGSKEKYAFDKCPCCQTKIKEAFYPEIISVMTSEENIKYLEEKKKILLISEKLLNNREEELKLDLKVYQGEIKELYEKLKVLNSNLPSISIQKNLFREEFKTNEEIDKIIEVNEKIRNILLDQDYTAKNLKKIDEKLSLLPKNNISEETKKKIEKLKGSLLFYLEKFGLNQSNLEKTEISQETYFPTIDDFNIKINISASDFVRIQWAYTLALIENSIFTKKLLVLDEPAQQNISLHSLEELFTELNGLNDVQSIVTYAINEEKTQENIDYLKKNNINYIFIEEKSIKKL